MYVDPNREYTNKAENIWLIKGNGTWFELPFLEKKNISRNA